MAINSLADYVRETRGILAGAGFMRGENDGVVWYERGAGHPTVLLHGVNDQAGTWFPVAPALPGHVIIPDLAGHGWSEPRSGPIAMSHLLGQLEALLAGEDDLTLVGNSFGGVVALLFTLRNRGRVKRLFLESSGGLSRPLGVPLVAHDRDVALQILRAVHGPRYQPEEWVVDALLQRATDSPMLRLTGLQEHEVEPRLGEIDVPATLIWGADDGVVPLPYAEELRAAIPGAVLHVIEGAAHIPHIQQPARFLECLTAIS